MSLTKGQTEYMMAFLDVEDAHQRLRELAIIWDAGELVPDDPAEAIEAYEEAQQQLLLANIFRMG